MRGSYSSFSPIYESNQSNLSDLDETNSLPPTPPPEPYEEIVDNTDILPPPPLEILIEEANSPNPANARPHSQLYSDSSHYHVSPVISFGDSLPDNEKNFICQNKYIY